MANESRTIKSAKTHRRRRENKKIVNEVQSLIINQRRWNWVYIETMLIGLFILEPHKIDHHRKPHLHRILSQKLNKLL